MGSQALPDQRAIPVVVLDAVVQVTQADCVDTVTLGAASSPAGINVREGIGCRVVARHGDGMA